MAQLCGFVCDYCIIHWNVGGSLHHWLKYRDVSTANRFRCSMDDTDIEVRHCIQWIDL